MSALEKEKLNESQFKELIELIKRQNNLIIELDKVTTQIRAYSKR